MKFEWARPVSAGFRIVVQRQWSFLAWSGLGLVCGLAGVLIALVTAGGLAALVRAGAPAVTRAGITIDVCAMVLGSPIVCAIYRAVLRPTESRFAYLRLGAAELKTITVLIPLAGAWVGLSYLSNAAGPWKPAVLIAGLLALSPVALSAPAVFARGRYADLRRAFGLGRRYFWELVGINLITWVMFLGIDFLIHTGWALFISTSRNDVFEQMLGRRDLMFVFQMFLAAGVVWLFHVAELVVVVAPGADFYRRLAGPADLDLEPVRTAPVAA